MGWVALVLLVGLAIGVALAAGLPRALVSLMGAALALGAAGYALQGRPGLAGAPVLVADRQTTPMDPAMVELRTKMFGRFNAAQPFFYAADALGRGGSFRSAITLLQGGVNAQPANAALWTGLGTAYAEHDRSVSPAARLAFARALQVAPKHPGPPFFLGLALVRSGQFREAQRWWNRAYALTPDRMGFKADINARLAVLEAFLDTPMGRTAP